MKQLGIGLFVAGVFIAGGTALAGSGDKCNVCHYPSHDIEEYGDIIVTSESGWHSSHRPHGDCTLDYPTMNADGVLVQGVDMGDGSCMCDELLSEPTEEPPAP
jgi:hypothetical protein